MDLVTSFVVLLQPWAVTMSAPSFDNLCTVLAGWTFAPRRTVTSMLQAAGAVGLKHHSAFHRLFASASWSLDRLGLIVFNLVEPHLAEGQVFLALDDRLARKRGLKVFGAGLHHDPLISTRKRALTNWGHSWIVLAVIVRFRRWPERAFALPVLFRLYLNHAAAERHRRVYRTRPALAVDLLRMLCSHRKLRQFQAIGDSSYGGQSVLKCLPSNCHLTSRLHLDARLYDAPPERLPGTNGRPRKRGSLLPAPRQMLAQRAKRLTLDLYGRHDQVRLAESEARWHCAPDRPLRIVAVDPIHGQRKRQAFYSTCHEASGEQVLAWYASRWSLEVTFHDSQQSLGFEQPQGWTRQAVERTAPMAMLLYTLIVVWFIDNGHRSYQVADRPWYRQKQQASFADMLATLRRQSIREKVLSLPHVERGSRKLIQTLENITALAA